MPPERGIAPWVKYLVLFTGIVLAATVLTDMTSTSRYTPPTGSAVAPAPPTRGAEVRLFVEGAKDIPLALDEEVLEEITTAVAARNTPGYLPWIMAALAVSGRVVVVEPNARAIVLSTDKTKTRVRMISGQEVGRDGWVYTFMVKSIQ
jgi:hypothetical protein